MPNSYNYRRVLTYDLSVVPVPTRKHLVVFILPQPYSDLLPLQNARARTSSRLFTTNPSVFMIGLTCAANARSNCLASSSAAASFNLSGAIKLTCGFGLASFSLILTCTMVRSRYFQMQDTELDRGSVWEVHRIVEAGGREARARRGPV